MALLRNDRGRERAACVGHRDGFGRHGGGHRYGLSPARGSCAEYRRRLRLHQRCGDGQRRRWTRCGRAGPRRLERGRPVRRRGVRTKFQLARNPCGGHDRCGRQRFERRGRRRFRRARRSAARARSMRRLHLRHRGRDHLGIRRQRERRARERQSGARAQSVARRRRILRRDDPGRHRFGALARRSCDRRRRQFK